jgi:hypothetical protein
MKPLRAELAVSTSRAGFATIVLSFLCLSMTNCGSKSTSAKAPSTPIPSRPPRNNEMAIADVEGLISNTLSDGFESYVALDSLRTDPDRIRFKVISYNYSGDCPPTSINYAAKSISPEIGKLSSRVQQITNRSPSPQLVFRHVPGVQNEFDFIGAQAGRWRVWALSSEGLLGLPTSWTTFRYLR